MCFVHNPKLGRADGVSGHAEYIEAVFVIVSSECAVPSGAFSERVTDSFFVCKIE